VELHPFIIIKITDQGTGSRTKKTAQGRINSGPDYKILAYADRGIPFENRKAPIKQLFQEGVSEYPQQPKAG
jgi:hypothetical protein